MSVPATGIIETIVGLLDEETAAIKAGQFSRIAETAERKARLMHQLSHAEVDNPSSENLNPKIEVLRNALKTNLRACKENLETLRYLIAIQMTVELDMENDGTYAISGKHARAI